MLPDVGKSLELAAESTNEFARQMNAVLRNTKFEELFVNLKDSVDFLFDGITLLAGTMEPLLNSAAPAAERLADAFADAAARMSRWTSDADNLGRLTDALVDGVDSLLLWVDLLGSVGDLLATVFAAGRAEGDSFVSTLTDIVDRWDGFLESAEGQDALAEFFEMGRRSLEAMSPILDSVKEAVQTLYTDEAIGNLEKFSVGIGELIEGLAQLLALIGDLGLATAIGTLAGLVGDLAAIVDEFASVGLLEFIGGAAIAIVAVVKLTKGFVAMRAAVAALLGPSGFIAMNPVLFGLGVAAAALGTAFLTLKSNTEEISTAGIDLADSFKDGVEQIIATTDATDAAAIAVEAFRGALEGDELDDFKREARELGLDVDDLAVKFREDIPGAMSDVAAAFGETFGLSTAEVEAFSEALSTGMTEVEAYNYVMEETGALAEGAGRRIRVAAVDIYDFMDAADSGGLTTFNEGLLASLEIGDSFERQVLADALAVAGLAPSIDIAALSQEELNIVTREAERLLIEKGVAEELANDAMREGINLSISGREAAWQREAAMLAEAEATQQLLEDQMKLTAESRAAEIENRKLAEGVREVARSVLLAADANNTYLPVFAETVDKLNEGARAAGLVAGAFDLLVGTNVDGVSALSDWEASLDGVTESIAENGTSLDLTTEKGRENTDAILELVDASLAMAEADLATGVSAQQAADNMLLRNLAIADSIAPMFESAEAAQAYIDTLGLTPANIVTIFSQPGLVEALSEVDDLKVKLDDAGRPVITSMTLEGVALSQEEVDDLNEKLGNLSDEEIQALITMTGNEEVLTALGDITSESEEIDENTVELTIDYLAVTDAGTEVDTLQQKLEDLDAFQAIISVEFPEYFNRLNELNELIRVSDTLNRTVTQTIVTNYVNNGVPGDMRGGIESVTGGAMAGRIVAGDQFLRVGERGLREAIIPLELPINQVNPEVRGMAELIRNGNQQPGTTVAPTFNIYEVNDAETTALRVMNRVSGLV